MAFIERNEHEMSKNEVRKSTSAQIGRVTLASIESLAIPLVQEVVFMADFRCARCQQRVAEVMSKMNGETQSVVVSVLEKKVTLTCTNPKPPRESSAGRVAQIYRIPISKFFLIKRLMLPSCS